MSELIKYMSLAVAIYFGLNVIPVIFLAVIHGRNYRLGVAGILLAVSTVSTLFLFGLI